MLLPTPCRGSVISSDILTDSVLKALTVADGRWAGYVTIWAKRVIMLELIITLCTIVATGLALAGLIVARWNKLGDRLRTVETGLAELRGALIHGNIRPKSKPAD